MSELNEILSQLGDYLQKAEKNIDPVIATALSAAELDPLLILALYIAKSTWDSAAYSGGNGNLQAIHLAHNTVDAYRALKVHIEKMKAEIKPELDAIKTATDATT